MSDYSSHGKRKLNAASVSVGVNLTLILIKIAAALLSGSIAILAEVFHSGLDLLASVFAYVGIRQAAKPEDEDHPYGHERFENLSSLIQTLLIAITSFLIIYEAVGRLKSPHSLDATWLALAIMLLTLIADFFVARYLHKVSGETGSSALEADAYHFTTDLWSAVAVIIGLVFASLGWSVFDSIAAIFVALLMLWISYKLATKSLRVMLDTSPCKVTLDDIGMIVAATPGVVGFHKLRARQSGSRLLADMNIHVNPKITVLEGHTIAHRAKHAIMEKHPEFKDINIHVEPQRTDELRLKKLRDG
jgi:cation diffusion facilitator family transporter